MEKTKNGSRTHDDKFYLSELEELFRMSQDKEGKIDLFELATNCLNYGYEKGVSYAAKK